MNDDGGYPRKHENRTSIHVSLEQGVVDALDEYRGKQDRSPLVEQAIREFLADRGVAVEV